MYTHSDYVDDSIKKSRLLFYVSGMRSAFESYFKPITLKSLSCYKKCVHSFIQFLRRLLILRFSSFALVASAGIEQK